MLKSIRLAELVVLTVSFLSIPTLAQQDPPSADTCVSETTPDITYGYSSILAVGSGTTCNVLN